MHVCLCFCCVMQLRQTVRKFCGDKLAPYADEIDKNNEFPKMRVSQHRFRNREPCCEYHRGLISYESGGS